MAMGLAASLGGPFKTGVKAMRILTEMASTSNNGRSSDQDTAAMTDQEERWAIRGLTFLRTEP